MENRKPTWKADNKRDGGRRPDNVIIGRNAVNELIRAAVPIEKIYVSGKEGSVRTVVSLAKENGITLIQSKTETLDRLAGSTGHQGVVAVCGEKEYSSVDDIIGSAREKNELPLIVICDGVEDPHNLGAIIRSAECCGAHGVIIPERRSCGLTATVSKASAGALAHMKIAKVVNIGQTVEKLKESGIWTFAAEAGGTDYYELDWSVPCAIVMGGEDSGVSRLVRERCDFTASIPMYGKVNSLNVSTAAAVLLSHAARMQRTPKK
jgi:23S rRNA (guanosine2251-2'-O)-methyltransferase